MFPLKLTPDNQLPKRGIDRATSVMSARQKGRLERVATLWRRTALKPTTMLVVVQVGHLGIRRHSADIGQRFAEIYSTCKRHWSSFQHRSYTLKEELFANWSILVFNSTPLVYTAEDFVNIWSSFQHNWYTLAGNLVDTESTLIRHKSSCQGRPHRI